MDHSTPCEGTRRGRFARHSLGKLVVFLSFFAILTVVGDRILAEYWRNFTRETNVKIVEETPSALRKAWRFGLAVNLFGCVSAFCVVHLLRVVCFAPITELLGAMLCRIGIPALCCLPFINRSGLTEFQALFHEWALFYIVLVYLVALPLDVWLVLPNKVESE